MLPAVGVALSSPEPASKPEGSCCLQTWVPFTCSSCHDSWNPTPNAVDPRALSDLWDPDTQQLCCPHGNTQLATQFQEPANAYTSEPQIPGFAIFWCQKACLPTEHGGLALPTVPDSKRPLTTTIPKEQKCPIPQWVEESYNLPLCMQHQKLCFPMVHRSPALHAALPCKRAGVPFPLNSTPLICWYEGARDLTLTR
jgi:hypothetical protein